LISTKVGIKIKPLEDITNSAALRFAVTRKSNNTGACTYEVEAALRLLSFLFCCDAMCLGKIFGCRRWFCVL